MIPRHDEAIATLLGLTCDNLIKMGLNTSADTSDAEDAQSTYFTALGLPFDLQLPENKDIMMTIIGFNCKYISRFQLIILKA